MRKLFFLFVGLVIFSFFSGSTFASQQDCNNNGVACTATLNGQNDTCPATCGSSSSTCLLFTDGCDSAGNCKGICSPPGSSGGYKKGSCTGSSSVCYTADEEKIKDLAPGYACGDKEGYVLGKADNFIGQVKNSVPRCSSNPPGAPDGVCCDPGTAKPPLPPRGTYSLGTSGGPVPFGCGAPDSICYTGPQTNATHYPGDACGTDKDVSAYWHYGGKTGEGIPSCQGIGACCDAGSGNIATAIPPNPCPAENGKCTKIDTAVGTIDVSGPGGFIQTAFGVLLSISGGVAIILIIFSGYRIMTAQGDSEKLKGAQEMLTSAIIGLLFMIFSVTILRIIGIDILHIPGFGK